MVTVAKPNCLSWFVNKKGMIKDATFIHSDPEHAKIDKPRENEAKIRRSRDETGKKRVVNHTLDINCIA